MTDITLKLYHEDTLETTLLGRLDKKLLLMRFLSFIAVSIAIIVTVGYIASYLGVFRPSSHLIAELTLITMTSVALINPVIKINGWLLLFCVEAAFSSVMNNPEPQYFSFQRLDFFVLMISFLSPFASNNAVKYAREIVWRTLLGGLLLLLYSSFIVYVVDEFILHDTSWMFSGVLGHGNLLGVVCGITILISIYHLLFSIKNASLIGWGITFLISIWLLFLTSSRASILAVVAASLILIVVALRRKQFIRLTAIGISIALLVVAAHFSGSTHGIEKKNDIAEQHNSLTYSRDALWNARIIEFKSSPLFGKGFCVNNNFVAENHQLYNMDYSLSKTEPGSSWLALLANTGVIGAFLFMAFMCSCGKRLMVALKKRIDISILYASFLIFLLGQGCFEGWVLYGGSLTFFIFWLLTSRIYSLKES